MKTTIKVMTNELNQRLELVKVSRPGSGKHGRIEIYVDDAKKGDVLYTAAGVARISAKFLKGAL